MSAALSFSLRVDKDCFKKVNDAQKLRVRQCCKRVADAVCETARALCPVDTGELRASIHVEGSGNQSFTQYEVIVGLDYGVYQEFGTKYIAAQPFLGPAVDIASTTWEDDLAQALNQAFDEGCSL